MGSGCLSGCLKDTRLGRVACPRALKWNQYLFQSNSKSGGKPPFPTCDPCLLSLDRSMTRVKHHELLFSLHNASMKLLINSSPSRR
jgi:hypothetical protein